MYWIWANERSNDSQARFAGVPEAIERENLRFDRGAAMGRPIPPIDIVRDAEAVGTITDNLIAPGVRGLVFSSRLRQLLQRVGVDNIEYFPCRLLNVAEADVAKDYQIANLVGRVACVNLSASDLEMDPDNPERIEYINSLTLNEDAIRGALMFRLKEHAQVIVVEDRVKTACESAGITGVRFYSPEEFSL